MKLKLPKREKNSKKYDNGHIIAVGGNLSYSGAAYFASLSAMRTGTDIVHVFCPEKAALAISCLCPDIIALGLKGSFLKEEHYKKIKRMLEKSRKAVLLIGNGAGTRKETKRLMARLSKEKQKKVADADALKAISILSCKEAILTPHKRELAGIIENSLAELREYEKRAFAGKKKILKKGRASKDNNTAAISIKEIAIIKKSLEKVLCKLKEDKEDSEEKAFELAEALKEALKQAYKLNRTAIVVAAKGKHDVIASKDKAIINKTGCPAMTVAGTGDIMAGICAGFLSQGCNMLDSALYAAYLNGRIGKKLSRSLGNGIIASDFLGIIARELKELQ